MKNIVPGESPCHCINVRRTANLLTRFYDKALAPINLSASQFSLLNKTKEWGLCNKKCAGTTQRTGPHNDYQVLEHPSRQRTDHRDSENGQA